MNQVEKKIMGSCTTAVNRDALVAFWFLICIIRYFIYTQKQWSNESLSIHHLEII